ncbi:MAG TPA: hypothetical protein PKD09_10660 [Aggregatilinea sp.]|uniref:hypothetical protein n=1 Tax=Aggregatilinea sp. TaxID=2806333 RepID=UPI002C016EC5|nr:hypothetical protein [Aggregatilinea sp.]HML22104.1 hypothetical protein [Aggregatilinea sp.]
MSIFLRDYAEVFEIDATAPTNQNKLVIDRPDRPREHHHTYDLATITQASRARLERLLDRMPTSYEGLAFTGWKGYATQASSVEPGRGERLDMLEEARTHIQEAIRLVRTATAGTREEARADAYLISTLQMCTGNPHGYLGRQRANIDELLESLES